MTPIKIIRITTVPMSLKLLLTGQMNFMQKKGFEVITMSANGKEREYVINEEKIPHIIIPMTRKITPFQDLQCLWILIKHFKKIKPDIVHTHTPKAGLLGMLAAKICGVKVKIHTIAGLPLMTASGNKRELLKFIERLTYWAADYVLPNSNSIMSFVRENKFTKNAKLSIIGKGSSNWIDLNRFSRNAIQEDILEKVKKNINYKATNKYLLSIGRVVKDKGIVELVESFLEVNKSHHTLKLILVGSLEKEREEELLPQHILAALKKHKDIIHINWSDEVEYYMFLADILIHASYREGFPNVPLQAGAMECPIICSEIPGNIDIVTEKKTGLYFQVGDVDSLVGRMKYALDNSDLMKEYAIRLRKEVEANFSREYIHQELLKFYKQKLSERG